MDLLINSQHGIYVPEIFAKIVTTYYSPVDQSVTTTLHHPAIHGRKLTTKDINLEDIDILRAGPEQEYYWEAWETVMNATFTDDYDYQYHLNDDHDLFLERQEDQPKYVDVKVTVWQRMTLPDSLTSDQINDLRDAANNAGEIPSWIYEQPEYELETLTDTEEIHENSVQLLNERGELVIE